MEHPEASLLGLPIELRLQILSYLLPNVDCYPPRQDSERVYPAQLIKKLRRLARRRDGHAASYLARHSHKANARRKLERSSKYMKLDVKWQDTNAAIRDKYINLRHDLQRCEPAILRINRQIHQEGADIIYSRPAQACLGKDNFLMLNEDCIVARLEQPLVIPQVLQHLRSVELMISSGWPCTFPFFRTQFSCTELCRPTYFDGIYDTVHILSTLQDLKRLNVIFDTRCDLPSTFMSKRDACDMVLMAVRPFGRLRGLTRVRFAFQKLESDEEALDPDLSMYPMIRNEIAEIIRRMHSDEPVQPEAIDLRELKKRCMRATKQLFECMPPVSPRYQCELYHGVWDMVQRGDMVGIAQLQAELRRQCHSQIAAIQNAVTTVDEMV